MAGAPFYRCYQVRDGGHVAVAAIEPAAQMDRAQWAPTHARFTETFLTRTRDDWAKHFGGTDACVTPVLSFAQAPLHPQAAAAFTVAMPGGWPVPRAVPRFQDASTEGEYDDVQRPA